MTKHAPKGFDIPIAQCKSELAALESKCSDSRRKFVDAATGFFQTWYKLEAEQIAKTEYAVTLGLGEKREKLMADIASLGANARIATAKFIDTDDVWNSLVATRAAYSGSPVRPRELVTAMNLIAGLLGPVMQEFGYLVEPGVFVSWREYDATRTKKESELRSSYPGVLEWNETMNREIKLFLQSKYTANEKRAELKELEKQKNEKLALDVWNAGK